MLKVACLINWEWRGQKKFGGQKHHCSAPPPPQEGHNLMHVCKTAKAVMGVDSPEKTGKKDYKGQREKLLIGCCHICILLTKAPWFVWVVAVSSLLDIGLTG